MEQGRGWNKGGQREGVGTREGTVHLKEQTLWWRMCTTCDPVTLIAIPSTANGYHPN